jgi:glutathione peroxidase|tara:strand:- start:2114 stop:2668 length:555 start_codon:yes stop_codon:yes gene_type:complete
MTDKIKYFILIFIMIFFTSNASGNYDKLAYDFNFNDLDGSKLQLSNFKNNVIVVVNVASQCGFTSQYEDMQKIWEKYQSKGLIMLGVPSNDFGNQEPGNSKDIKNFCEAKFGISFPMTEKVNVKGDNAHPFYKWAKKNHGNSAIPKWNFYKIVIDKQGKIHTTFSSMTNPSSKKFIKTIEKLLE